MFRDKHSSNTIFFCAKIQPVLLILCKCWSTVWVSFSPMHRQICDLEFFLEVIWQVFILTWLISSWSQMRRLYSHKHREHKLGTNNVIKLARDCSTVTPAKRQHCVIWAISSASSSCPISAQTSYDQSSSCLSFADCFLQPVANQWLMFNFMSCTSNGKKAIKIEPIDARLASDKSFEVLWADQSSSILKTSG